MNTLTASKAYAKIGVESGVIAADPHKLISMLYQGALLAIANAKNGILQKNIPAKCAAISKAMAIIDEGLNACLDKETGGELAKNLSSLYDYMGRRLFSANLNNDMDALNEVARLLNELKEAWESIRQVGTASAVAEAPPVKKEALVYEVPDNLPQAMAASARTAQPTKKTVSVAPAPESVTSPQTKAAVAAQPVKPVAATPALPPQQQRVVNKVQALYGRM